MVADIALRAAMESSVTLKLIANAAAATTSNAINTSGSTAPLVDVIGSPSPEGGRVARSRVHGTPHRTRVSPPAPTPAHRRERSTVRGSLPPAPRARH